jgi:hypothetical protein
MYARVSRWEGGDAEAIRATAAEISERSKTGPPEGVPGKALLLLTDPDNGRAMAIGLFETEADLRQGDAALNAMDPPGPGMGRRAAVEMYEVAVDVHAEAHV